jgi:predicted nucleotidyltransferase
LSSGAIIKLEKGRTLFDLIRLRLALKERVETEVEIVTPGTLQYLRERVLCEARSI